MVKRNPHFANLSIRYLFPEIFARKHDFLKKNPGIRLISLGIGDTTEPIPRSVVEGLIKKSTELGTRHGYTGYGAEQGVEPLRQSISSVCYPSLGISADDIFISDGSKCDIGRLQQLFGPEVSIAVQDPSYPVYVDGSLIEGVRRIIAMPCTSDNSFFPDFSCLEPVDLIYFCSPNNPTGVAATKAQLEALVAFAKKNGSIIIFDAAYSWYIQDPSLPRSIYEIPGSEEVAIELGSFSKLAGFTGVRLGWTVIPSTLKYDDGSLVKDDWKRLTTTVFNAASNISQEGGLAALSPQGVLEMKRLIAFYLENASLIKQALLRKGLPVFGGDNAPYLWAHFGNRKSWDVFTDLLEKAHVICTPGIGFGRSGEGFIRFTAFGHREDVLEGVSRLARYQL